MNFYLFKSVIVLNNLSWQSQCLAAKQCCIFAN